MPELPSRARVVIVGGGVIGTSVAYHLTALGWTDVLVLEQGRLSCGTTWHAAGLLGQLRATESGTRLVQYSARLYQEIEQETGLATGYKPCGGVTVARSADRLTQLRRTAATAEAFDLECELIGPGRAQELYPLMDTTDLLGALWLPGDATVNPVDVTASLARGARMRGAVICEQTRVTAVDVRAGAVAAVVTDRGRVETEVVVNCAGQWAKAVGAMCGVTVPLHSAEHFYVVTEQVEGVEPTQPILRDPDGYTYIREDVGGLLVGGFEPEAKPWVSPHDIPYPFEFRLLDEDWDHFSILMESAIHRIPSLSRAGIRKFYNGPESFTPDNQFVLGEAPGVRNFFVCAGFNSVGIASAGGAGQALSEWIVEGEPTRDLSAVDIRRFAPFNGNVQWLRDRVGEVLGLHYAIPWPNRELTTARPFRRSPLYDRLEAAGACFGSKMGWERANFFAPAGTTPAVDYTWGRPGWLAWSEEEHLAARRDVAVFDQTSFGKLVVKGRHAERVLQNLCAGDMAVEAGRTVYTPMLNTRAGYEADVTVTRLSPDEYLLVTSSASVIRDLDWINRHIGPDDHAQAMDVSGAYAVIGVMGPKARELLQAASDADLSDGAFPFGTSREIDVGHATLRATRITYVGELGWELYVPSEFAAGTYDLIRSLSRDFGGRDAGYYAINSLRLEKGYRAWGSDLTPDYTPVEAGLTFACDLASGKTFVGRAALEAARSEGPGRRLVSLVVEDPSPMLWGGELIRQEGRPVGQVTSAAWGPTLGAPVALGYVRNRDLPRVTQEWLRAGGFSIDVEGRSYPTQVHTRAPYDPDGLRIKV